MLHLVQGDITQVPVDAISNAANAALRGGGGVDGAIHRAGGEAIMAELDVIRAEQGGCPTGSAVATTAGRLPATYVFHAVGPIYSGAKRDAEMLASCYRRCLELADERQVKRISFPSISTGVYGYPLDEAAPIAVGTVADWLANRETSVEEAIFVLFDRRTLEAYERALKARVRN
ncbi:MAG: O-acetyl-ADP-ribose deacetylase [Acidobacteria bacterium]|nr:O-acetyl-ADP-ribose deacetylase [Acidobacteriota bacterium]